MKGTGPAGLEAMLGYRFRDRTLLETALTPPSAGTVPDNQRMEFLGDAILQLAVSELIFREKPDWDEGAMSKLRGMLVCTETLCGWSEAVGVELRTGPRSGKKAAGAPPRKPRADAMEALIAAVYLDAGDQAAAVVSRIVSTRFLDDIRKAGLGVWETRDSKTTLQERAAARSLPMPVYELRERSGPDHAPRFVVEVRVGELRATGQAGTLKGAQMVAARELLAALGKD